MSLRNLRYSLIVISFLFLLFTNAYSQTEVEPWGNITGIRVKGQLMAFESSLQVISSDWKNINATALERQRPKYSRDGNKQIVTTRIDSFYFTQQVEENEAESSAKVNVQFAAKKRYRFCPLVF